MGWGVCDQHAVVGFENELCVIGGANAWTVGVAAWGEGDVPELGQVCNRVCGFESRQISGKLFGP